MNDITMQTESEKLSVTEKVGYSLGDLAANLIFQTCHIHCVLLHGCVSNPNRNGDVNYIHRRHGRRFF